MRGRMASGRIDGDAAHVVDEGGFEHPYKLTYAASAGAVDEQTGEADGAWIIWLPDGCLVIDGEAVDLTSGMTAANNYPSGWYDITDVFDGTDPDDFDLYLDASKDDPKFVIDPDDAENPVLIAQVDDKAVKGIVESALVFSKGGNKKPFDIKRIVENESVSVKLTNCAFMVAGRAVSLADKIVHLNGGASIFLKVTISPPGEGASAPTMSYSIETTAQGGTPSGSQGNADAGDEVIFAPLYDVDAEGRVLMDCRDALVTVDWGGVKSVNDLVGAIKIEGDGGIKVETDAASRTITISYDESGDGGGTGDDCNRWADDGGGDDKPENDWGEAEFVDGGGGGFGGGDGENGWSQDNCRTLNGWDG